MMYELERMGKDAVATSSEANGYHFENAQSGLLSYLTRIISGTVGMLSGPACSA